MNAELQGYTDSDGVSSTARPVSSHTSASAQIGEAGSFEPSKRSGAATRLNMDDVVMTTSSEASFPPGLEGAAVPPGDKSVAFEGTPAQNMPKLAPGDTNLDKIGDDARIEVDVSEWTLDEWLTDRRGIEDPVNIIDTGTMTYVWGARVRDTKLLLTPSVLPVKVGLLPSVIALKDWKAASLHDHAVQIKSTIRDLSKEYKKVDVLRPYAKAGPIVTASDYCDCRGGRLLRAALRVRIIGGRWSRLWTCGGRRSGGGDSCG